MQGGADSGVGCFFCVGAGGMRRRNCRNSVSTSLQVVGTKTVVSDRTEAATNVTDDRKEQRRCTSNYDSCKILQESGGSARKLKIKEPGLAPLF